LYYLITIYVHVDFKSGISIYGFFEENINNVKNTIDNTFYTSCLACTVMVML